MKKRNRGGRRKSKTAPLRRRIRRLKDERDLLASRLTASDGMVQSLRKEQERSRLVAKGRSLFVLSIEDVTDASSRFPFQTLRVTVERAHWDGGSLAWDGSDTQLCAEIKVDSREIEFGAIGNDALGRMLRDRGAMIGAELVRRLWESQKATGSGMRGQPRYLPVR